MTTQSKNKVFVRSVMIEFLGVVKENRKKLERTQSDTGASHSRYTFLDILQESLERHISGDNRTSLIHFKINEELVKSLIKLNMGRNAAICFNFLVVAGKPITNMEFLLANPMPRTESYHVTAKLVELGLAFEEPYNSRGNSANIARNIFLPSDPEILISEFIDKKIAELIRVKKEIIKNIQQVKEK